MVQYCFVEKCKTTRYKSKEGEENSSHNVPLFGFPTDTELRKKWVKALLELNNQESVLQFPKTSRICAKHFTSDCLERYGHSYRLKYNSIPTIFPRSQNEKSMTNILDKQNIGDDDAISSDNIDHTFKNPKSSNKLSIPADPLLRYPGDITEDFLNTMNLKQAREAIIMCQNTLLKKNQTIKRLRTQNSRLHIKIQVMSYLLEDLNKNSPN